MAQAVFSMAMAAYPTLLLAITASIVMFQRYHDYLRSESYSRTTAPRNKPHTTVYTAHECRTLIAARYHSKSEKTKAIPFQIQSPSKLASGTNIRHSQCIHDATNNAKINILDPVSNPLNLILPGFETLWRVVLRLFIVLHNGESPENEHCKSALVEFMRNPAHAQFYCQLDNHTDASISAEYVVLEALRLYPPTRRVRRAFEDSDPNSTITTVAADVEAVYLDTQTWGPDAIEFTPGRWMALSSAQKDSFLAFDAGPSVSPASKSFRPMVIGLLVGLLLEGVGKRDEDENGASWKLVFGSDSQSNMDEVFLKREVEY
ncbi:uncharacterized protein BDV14DRAFT_204648 [Aspergillus stella-maris]|uniref:uncharacterized protein n=1 Tax=Aspergillus stella-maris TaxID=1810926 RepID=UPI003CCCBD95